MNINILHIKMVRRLIPVATMAILLVVSACSGGRHTDQGNDTAAVQNPDSLTERNIEEVRQSILGEDAEKFASKVSYPVERPYPLRDIKDSAEMKKYFRVLVDDSIKNVVRRNKGRDWESDGWRGWTMAEGCYLWFDGEKVYAIDYTSERERELLDSLRRDEIESLDKELRGGWVPVKVLEGVNDGTVFRIDRDSLGDDDSDNVTVRLAVYPPRADYHSRPRRLLKGKMRHEGTVGARVFEFSDSSGMRAEYNDMQSTPDEPLDIIEVTSTGDTVTWKVTPAYWRDVIRKR